MSLSSTPLVVLAALFWGLSGGIAGILMADGWDPFVVSFYRAAVGLVFVTAWLVWRSRVSGLRKYRLWLWSALAGLGVAGNFAFYFVSIAEGSVAVAATLMYCAPVFVYLVSIACKIEKSSPLKWAAIAVVTVGIVLLTRFYDVDMGSVTPTAVVAGLLAGLSYAAFIFGFKYATPHGSPQAILVIAFAVVVCILIWPADSEQTIAVLTGKDWPIFAALGVLGAGLSFILYVIGLSRTPPAVAAFVAMVEPVVASLFGVFILNESLVGLQLVGMGLILVTVTGLSILSSTQKERVGADRRAAGPGQHGRR